MENFIIVNNNNMNYVVYKEDTESFDEFYARSWYISNKMQNTTEEYKKIIELSKIWRNIQFLNNTYPKEIVDIL